MDRRFAVLFPEMEKPRFSTLHALSLSILRRYCEITGGAMFSLLPDSAPVVRELLRKQINGFISEELLRNALSALECEAVQTGKHTAQSVEGCDMEQLFARLCALQAGAAADGFFPTCCAMPTVRWSACRHCWRNCRRTIPMCRSTKRRTLPHSAAHCRAHRTADRESVFSGRRGSEHLRLPRRTARYPDEV